VDACINAVLYQTTISRGESSHTSSDKSGLLLQLSGGTMPTAQIAKDNVVEEFSEEKVAP